MRPSAATSWGWRALRGTISAAAARDLSWAESALLAVLPNAPSLIHMKRNRERLREKRDRLLDRIRSRPGTSTP